MRRALLTAHIIASVALLGDVAAVLAVNVRAATTHDANLAAASYDLLAMFSMMFGIPLSMGSLITGLLLGKTTKWGILRYRWVAAKLVLILSVVLVGSLVLGPGTDAMRNGDAGAETRLIVGAAWQAIALTLATTLSVYKPKGRLRKPREVSRAQRPAAARQSA